MTRWHTDSPVRAIPRLRAVAPVAPIDMYRTDRVAREAMRTARAFYRQKLRKWAKDRAAERNDRRESDP